MSLYNLHAEYNHYRDRLKQIEHEIYRQTQPRMYINECGDFLPNKDILSRAKPNQTTRTQPTMLATALTITPAPKGGYTVANSIGLQFSGELDACLKFISDHYEAAEADRLEKEELAQLQLVRNAEVAAIEVQIAELTRRMDELAAAPLKLASTPPKPKSRAK